MPVSHVRLTLSDVAVTLPTHNLIAGSIDGDTHAIQDGAATSLHTLGALELNANHQIEQDAISETHATAADDLSSVGIAQSGAIGYSHPLATGDLEQQVNQIQSGSLAGGHSLATTDLRQDNPIQGVSLAGSHNLVALDLGYSTPDLPLIQGGEIIQEQPQTGTFVAIPVSTIDAVDIYDENDVLAGADAHLSVNDSSDLTWLRKNYDYRNDSYAHFDVDPGLPDGVDVTSIDRLDCSLWLAMMGIWTDDPMTFGLRFIDGNGDPLTEQIVGTEPGNLTGTFTRFDASFQNFVTDPDLWADAQFELHWTHVKAGQEDPAAIAVSQIYVHGDYTAGFTNYNMHGRNSIQFARILVHQTLGAGDLNAVGTVQPASLSGDHILIASDITDQPNIVETAPIDVTHSLSAIAMTHRAEIEAAAIVSPTILAARNQDSTGLIESAILSAEGILEPDSLVAHPQIEQDAIGQNHVLGAGDIDSAGLLSSGQVLVPMDLAAGDIDQDNSEIESEAIEQQVILGAGDLSQINEVESSLLVQSHPLAAANEDSVGLIESASIGYEHILSCGDLQGETEIMAPNFLTVALLVRCTHVSDVTIESIIIDMTDNKIVQDLCGVAA